MNSVQQLFPSFSSSLVDDVNEHSVIHSYASGELIFRTGQFIKGAILILKGRIKIYREGEEGGEFFMYYLQPGQACAISMILSSKAEQSQLLAKAEDDVELIMVPLNLMNEWMLKHRSWYEFVVDSFRIRFEEVLTVIDNIAFRSMDQQLEFYLKRQYKTFGTKMLKISHQEIATDLNTSREVISRLLKRMEQLNKVKLFRNAIEIVEV